MRNIHPADELAMIRADLHRLKEREAFLRKGFLSLRFPTRGAETVATVKIIKQRRLRRDLLPKAVLENADYWETKVVRHVHVDSTKTAPVPMAGFPIDDSDFEVVER